MRFPRAHIGGIAHDGSALLIAVPTEGSFSLWLIPLPAGEPRRLGITNANNSDMFPDGRIVFAEMGSSRTDWFVADKNGMNPRKVLSLPGAVGNVSVSPDGKIVMVQEQPGDRRLFEIAADGTGLREVRRLSEDEGNFRWTPDGKYLVYQSGSPPHSDIWLLPMRTGLFRRSEEAIRLTNGPVPYSYPCPSRDGKQIFALGTKQRGELVRYDMKLKQFVPFLGGISATDPTFSRDGKWVAYASYPDHTIWRSRSDGSERLQLTFPPMDAIFPFISPDGTKVAFHTDKNEIYVVSMEGGTPQKINADNAFGATWSPDGNYLLNTSASPPNQPRITDAHTGKNSPVPGGSYKSFWLTQDIVAGPDEKLQKLVAFNLKTGQSTDLTPDVPDGIEHWMISPDSKYLYVTTGGADAKALRVRIDGHQLETITSLKDIHRVVNHGDTQINVAPDGSPIFTRDTGYQEIYALNIKWP